MLSEYDQKVVTQIEKHLPMNDDQLTQISSKIKTEALTCFKSKILGDVNQKTQEYLDKMKKQFKLKYDNIRKKNA